jgi:hypothetical protein
MGGQHHAPAALPRGKTRYPLYRRLGGPQGRSGRVRKISPPPGFDPRTVQSVASLYTDSATRPTSIRTYCLQRIVLGFHILVGTAQRNSSLPSTESIKSTCHWTLGLQHGDEAFTCQMVSKMKFLQSQVWCCLHLLVTKLYGFTQHFVLDLKLMISLFCPQAVKQD